MVTDDDALAFALSYCCTYDRRVIAAAVVIVIVIVLVSIDQSINRSITLALRLLTINLFCVLEY